MHGIVARGLSRQAQSFIATKVAAVSDARFSGTPRLAVSHAQTESDPVTSLEAYFDESYSDGA
jgi:hypothetical protein